MRALKKYLRERDLPRVRGIRPGRRLLGQGAAPDRVALEGVRTVLGYLDRHWTRRLDTPVPASLGEDHRDFPRQSTSPTTRSMTHSLRVEKNAANDRIKSLKSAVMRRTGPCR